MGHERVDGREVELRRLTDAVRAVNALLVNHLADAATTRDLAEEVRVINAGLLPLADAPGQRFGSLGPGGDPNDIFPFDIVLGPYNALGPAVDARFVDGEAVGEVVFTKQFEGPPGCCHGGVLAATFDQVLNVANIMSGVPGLTGELSVDYRRPTLLGVLTTFRARVDQTDGQKVITVATAEQDGEVTCEATGLFVQVAGDQSR